MRLATSLRQGELSPKCVMSEGIFALCERGAVFDAFARRLLGY